MDFNVFEALNNGLLQSPHVWIMVKLKSQIMTLNIILKNI